MNRSMHRRWSLLHGWKMVWGKVVGGWMMSGFGWVVVFICSALILCSSMIFHAALLIQTSYPHDGPLKSFDGTALVEVLKVCDDACRSSELGSHLKQVFS